MIRTAHTSYRPRWRAVVVPIVLTLVVAGCGGGEATNEPVSVPDAEHWDDGRVSFAYPEGWEVVEVGAADEYRLRIEPPGARDDQPDLPDATIVVFWPFLGNDSLDAVVRHWGVDDDDPVVEAVEERDVELAGASAAVRQDYRVRDASPDDLGEDPAQYRTLLAMGEVGRTLFVMVAAPEDGPIDVDTVADLVLGSLELRGTWR